MTKVSHQLHYQVNAIEYCNAKVLLVEKNGTKSIFYMNIDSSNTKPQKRDILFAYIDWCKLLIRAAIKSYTIRTIHTLPKKAQTLQNFYTIKMKIKIA